MRKILLTLLGIVTFLAILGGAGFVGYRIGYRQGAQADVNVVVPRFDRLPKSDQGNLPPNHPDITGRNFNRGFAPNRFPMMIQRGSFGFFSPFQFLWRLLIIGLVIWLGYQLFKGNGWQLSLTRNSPPAVPEQKTPPSDG